ncbi:MAG TPA: SLC13 family permease [Elusimicrobiota bacterium]|nr:SLC13 family permease [Elusimicrobiota bacterium]
MGQLVFAVVVFFGTYVWLATEKSPRYVIALCGAGVLILGHIFTLEEALAQVNWQTIALIFGMFTIVAALSESGFFNWLALSVARKLDYNPIRVFIVFPLLAAALSMFLDNITVMLFLTSLTLELCAYIPIDPIILVTAEVCAANTGGGATLVGAPPNVVMGTTLGYSFNSFLIHMAPSVWICTAVLMAVYYGIHRRHLHGIDVHNRAELDAVDLAGKITDRDLMMSGLAALGAAVVLLIGHHMLETQWHVPITVGLAALLPALALMVYEDRHGRDVMRKIDLESIVFFMGLFVIVGALDKVGAFRAMATIVLTHIHSPVAVIVIFLWFAAITSAFVDNVPMALSMAFLIKEMNGIPGAPPQAIVAWASLIGLLMGGNMTPIGASPNVVAYGVLEKATIRIGWKKWAALTVPPTVAALAVASILMWAKFAMNWY